MGLRGLFEKRDSFLEDPWFTPETARTSRGEARKGDGLGQQGLLDLPVDQRKFPLAAVQQETSLFLQLKIHKNLL